MRKKATYKILALAFFATGFAFTLQAQDPHFSQYYNNPLFVNPATCGNGINYVRLVAMYRNQWATVTSPFVNENFSVDKAVNKFGFGGVITNQHTGNAGYKSLNVLGTLAYHQPLGREKLNIVSVGFQVGLNQKSFDPSKMTFDDQYIQDVGYDPSIPTAEIFSETKVSTADLNLALHWQKGWGHDDVKFKPYAGITAFHITQPKESFIIDNNRLPMKFVATAGAGYKLNDQLEIKPSVLFMKQDNFYEETFGAVARFSPDNINTIEFGGYHRLNDAAIIYAGYQIKTLFIGLSYDANISSLSKNAGSANAFEISLTYVPTGKNRKHHEEQKEEIKTEKKKETPSEKTKVKPEHKAKKAESENETPVAVERSKSEEKITPAERIEKKQIEIPEVNAEPVEKKAAIENITPEVKNETPVAVEKPKREEKITPAAKIEKTQIEIPEVKAGPVEKKATENVKPEIKNETPVAVDKPKREEKITPAERIEKTQIEVPEVNAEPVEKKQEVIQPISEKPITIEQPVEVKVTPTEKSGDRDGDNVPDKFDHCPDVFGEVYLHGCPDDDQDADGIKDNEDKCPTEAGMKEFGGCPDSDGDGVADKEDHCPYTAGPKSNNGCPKSDIDADGDGIPDKIDANPYIKGTVQTHGAPDTDGDGITDADDPCPFIRGENNGCPEENATPVKTDNLEFDINSAHIRLDHFYPLEHTIDSLFEHKQWTIVVSGHTDGEGDEMYNMVLSQNRADAIRNYFINHGIAEDRIKTVAYGETKPLFTNSTDEGRKHNRRGEINILKEDKR